MQCAVVNHIYTHHICAKQSLDSFEFVENYMKTAWTHVVSAISVDSSFSYILLNINIAIFVFFKVYSYYDQLTAFIVTLAVY